MDGQMLMQVQEMLMHLKTTSFMFQILLVQKCVQNGSGHCLLTLLDAKVAEGLLVNTEYQ